MRMRVHVAAALVVLGIASNASAQIESGLNEISGRIVLESTKFNTDEERFSQLDLLAAYGRFLTERLEVGPTIGLFWLEGSDATGAAGGFVAYHFGSPASQIVPFVDVNLRRGFGDPIENPTIFGVLGGVKWFVGEGGGAIQVGPYWNHFRYSDEALGDASENHFGISVALNKYW
jgi:hypothetical protein